MVHYVGQEYDGQSLQDVLEDAQQFKMRKYAASLEHTLATSDIMFEDWTNEFIKIDDSNE
jgi:hypothetical protein